MHLYSAVSFLHYLPRSCFFEKRGNSKIIKAKKKLHYRADNLASQPLLSKIRSVKYIDKIEENATMLWLGEMCDSISLFLKGTISVMTKSGSENTIVFVCSVIYRLSIKTELSRTIMFIFIRIISNLQCTVLQYCVFF